MPAFDGTGPRGLGPMTGRGEGYCAIAFPPPGTGKVPYGYAGLAGTPVHPVLSLHGELVEPPAEGMEYPYGTPPVPATPFAPFTAPRFSRGLGRRRGRGRGRGRW